MTSPVNEICYKRNFLSEVVARIDFAEPAKSLSVTVLPGDVREVISQRYKIYEPSKAIKQGIELSPDGVTSTKEEFHQWVYYGENREKSITINRDAVHVTLREYQNSDEFKLDVIEPIRKVIEQEGDLYISRIGLRFVNIIPGVVKNYSDARTYFHPMISSSFDELVDAENCSRNFLITEYLHNEIKVRLQTGLYNPDYPAKIKKKDFIIDIDAYVDIPHVASDVNSLFDELHKLIQMKFESCITDDMRKVLNSE